MRVVVTNTALLNAGDAAIMMGTCAILRRAFGDDVEIAVRDQQADAASLRFSEFAIRPLLYDRIVAWTGADGARRGVAAVFAAALLWRTPLHSAVRRLLPANLYDDLAELAAADLVVSAGGTYLVPHYRLTPKLVELFAACLLGRPCVLFTQSLGPFGARPQRLLRNVLFRVRLILVRDDRSRANLAEVGIPPSRVVKCADAAFAMPPPAPAKRVGSNFPAVAVSVRDWPHFAGVPGQGMDRYLSAMATFVGILVERHDADVVFVSTCQGVPEYWTDDSRTADAVVARLPAKARERVTVDHEFRRPEELTDFLGAFNLVVATRMHAAILALNAGTPVLPIAYEFKTRELFEQLGFGDLVADIETLSAESLTARAGALIANGAAVRATIAGRVAAMRRSALAAVVPLQSLTGTTP